MDSVSARYSLLPADNVNKNLGAGLNSRRGIIFVSHLCCMIAGVAMGILLTTAFTVRQGRSCVECEVQPYSPALGALHYENRVTTAHILSPNFFIGEPREEVDLAWAALLQNPYFHVSKTEFSQLALDHESISLKGSQDRVLSFGVYHELHCLNTIRKRMHLDYYGVSSSKEKNSYGMWHAEHCIEFLRQNSICMASLMPITVDWYEARPGDPRPTPITNVTRRCVDWKKLDAWAALRKVNMFDLDNLAGMPGRGW